MAPKSKRLKMEGSIYIIYTIFNSPLYILLETADSMSLL